MFYFSNIFQLQVSWVWFWVLFGVFQNPNHKIPILEKRIVIIVSTNFDFTHQIQLLAMRLLLMLSMNNNAAVCFGSPVSYLSYAFPSKCKCSFAKSQYKSKSYVSWTNYNLKIWFKMFLCTQVIIMSDHNLSLKHCRNQLNPQ